MFLDSARLHLIAGNGGNGIVSWRKEKYIAKGGPYGGNGGPGGSIIIRSTSSIFSLEDYRHVRMLRAEHGGQGGTNNRQGKRGKDLYINVPLGTLIKDAETGALLCDLTKEGQEWTLLKGGKGGKGNTFFKSSTQRSPKKCTPGEPGESLFVDLELKLLADVGLVGLPNAGKSSLLRATSASKAKVGAYPFTTLQPNLSIIPTEDYSRISMADIPGIIEGAHEGKGLGITFLKHIERTSLLIFVIDSTHPDPAALFVMLQNELSAYREDNKLHARPFLVALNKIDLLEKKELKTKLSTFIKKSGIPGEILFPISAMEGTGLEALIDAVKKDLCNKDLSRKE